MRVSRERQQARIVIEQRFQFVGGEVAAAREEEDNSGVEVAGAGAHRDATRGGEPHRRIDGTALGYGAEAGAIAEMCDHEARGKAGFEGGTGRRPKRCNDGFIRETVETVTLDALLAKT